jgi:tetratricopeptide (TPR) repeat protein
VILESVLEIQKIQKGKSAAAPEIAITLAALADVLERQGALARATNLLFEAAAAFADHPPKIEPWFGDALLARFRGSGIECSRLEVIAASILRDARAISDPDPLWVALSMANLASVLAQNGKFSEARPLAKESVHICVQNPRGAPDQWMAERALTALRDAFKGEGQAVELEENASELVRSFRTKAATDDPWLAVVLADLALIQRDNGKADEANRTAQEAIEICTRARQPDQWMTDRCNQALRATKPPDNTADHGDNRTR